MFSKLPYFYMFMMIMGLGTLFSVSSIHWLGIWAGLEINLIGFLPLLVYKKTTMESESGVKYFVAQAMGSGLLLMGSLLVFNMTYSWEVYSQTFFNSNSNMNLNMAGIITIMSGLLLKLGMFPFHYWLPSVMSGLSWFSCMLLATWQKLAPLFLMISLFEQNSYYWILLITCLMSAASSILGGIGGFNQTQVRALLAYSSIGHLGWIMFACIHSEWVTKTYLLIYLMISIILFLSLLHSDSSMMKNISNLKNWSSARSVSMVMLLSLGGLPPLLGFVSKWLVMFYTITSPYKMFIMFFIVGSLLSLFYYLSLFFSMYLSELKKYNTKMQNNTLFFYDSCGLISLNLISVIFIIQYNFFTLL